MTDPVIVSGVTKSFTMHLRGGLRLPVVDGVDFSLKAGECAVLGGPSGVGKSSILKMIYGNYGVDGGRILVTHRGVPVDLVTATPRQVMAIRRETIGYVSQFLRALPRVAAIDVVAEPLVARGESQLAARSRAGELMAFLNLPEALFGLPPATFSGGEQQRVNIARGFITPHPVLLLDEPTASLDATNRSRVMTLIAERKAAGAALLGIFHDADMREAVADRIIDVQSFSARSAA